MAPQPGPISWNSTSYSAQNNDAIAPTMTQVDANSIMIRKDRRRPMGLTSRTAATARRVVAKILNRFIFLPPQ